MQELKYLKDKKNEMNVLPDPKDFLMVLVQ